MALICRPRFAYRDWNRLRSGISIWHGPHQVAQKTTRLVLPRKLNRAGFPWSDCTVTAGTVLPAPSTEEAHPRTRLRMAAPPTIDAVQRRPDLAIWRM